MSQLLWFTGPSGRGWESFQLQECLMALGAVSKSNLCRQGFLLPDCPGMPTWGVGLMDVENLIAVFQGNLKIVCFLALGWLPPEPSCVISGIGNQSLGCPQCHPLLSSLPDHPGICLWLYLQVWLYQEKGLIWEEHTWVMSALRPAGLVPNEVLQYLGIRTVQAGWRRDRVLSARGAVRTGQRKI